MSEYQPRVPVFDDLEDLHPQSCPLSLSIAYREGDRMPMVAIDDLGRNDLNKEWPYNSLHIATIALPELAEMYADDAKDLRLDEINPRLPEGYAPHVTKKEAAQIRTWVKDMSGKYAGDIAKSIAIARNRDVLLDVANKLCEDRWEALRDDIQGGHYNPVDVEDLARQGIAYADFAWALTLPEGETGHLDSGEVTEALGLDQEAIMDEVTARAVAVAFADHGTMQTEAFTDYLRSGDLAVDVEEELAGMKPYRRLSEVAAQAHATSKALNDQGRPKPPQDAPGGEGRDGR